MLEGFPRDAEEARGSIVERHRGVESTNQIVYFLGGREAHIVESRGLRIVAKLGVASQDGVPVGVVPCPFLGVG